jgi:signal transduction histidine kinase
VVIDGDLSGLSAAIEVAVYRITDELLTNVGRHASARACTVRVSRHQELEVTITDDGVGIAPDAAAGVGLVAIRERAAELGGTVALGPAKDGGPDGGTRATVRIPLPAGETQQQPGQAQRAGEPAARREVSVDAVAGADR